MPDRNYLSFLLCNFHTFTIPQALPRQLPLHKGAFFCLCEHCKKVLLFPQGGGIWNAPYGIRFCRSSRRQMVAPVVCTLYLRRWRRLPTATHIRPRQRKDTFFTLSNTLPAFSLVAPGAKKKLSKRNAKRETRKRELFEKSSLLNSRKNFLTTHTGHWACAPKVTRQPISPAARRFLKKAPS